MLCCTILLSLSLSLSLCSKKNEKVNGEFYVCPVYNNAIKGGLKVRTFDTPKMWGLGTPEDLKYYLENYGKQR